MDRSIVAIDGSRWGGDSVTSVVKPSGYVAGINLIDVDLGFATEEIDSPVHEHFSIRGFVAGMRKKDPKTCLPFALEGDDLPPLNIPDFRWWKCSNCIRDVCTESTTPKLKLLTSKKYHGKHGSKEIVNGEENNNNQMIIYNPPYNEEETNGRKSNNGNTHVDVAEAYQHDNNAGVAKNSNTRVDEPKNVSSGCDELPSKRKAKLVSLNNYTGAERRSNDQTSCKYRGIPDLNEPFIEIPSSSLEKKLLTPTECRSSALLKFLDACKQIARESKRQMGLHKVPNNIERCKTRAGKEVLNFPQPNLDESRFSLFGSLITNRYKEKNVIDTNIEDTRFAQDASAVREGSAKAARSFDASTQGQLPPRPRNIHLGGLISRAIQPSRSNVASNVCTLNRNPADFSSPDETNEFTISGNDLKPRKKKFLRKKIVLAL